MGAVLKNKDSGLQKIFSRGLLLTTLEKDVLLTGINVFDNGSIKLGTKNWNEYWLPVLNLKHKKVDKVLKHLYCSWNNYIDSSFDNSYRSVYCYYYFHLLELLIQIRTNIIHELWVNALRTVLGFECFSVFNGSIYQQSFAAGTCSLRNPCYLLSRLKMPNSLDDPQYLPLITISDTENPELYYHYRQYTLSPCSPLSLLLYPSVSIARRSESFALINILDRDLKNGIDPRTAERAKRIYDGIIRSIIKMYMYDGNKLDLEIVDIGAGTGSLVVAICREIRKHHVNCICLLRFLDLELADTTRFFRKDLLASLDGLEYWVNDYRDWHGYSQVSFQPKIL